MIKNRSMSAHTSFYRFTHALIGLLLLGLSPSLSANDECLKVVFKHYCLGGSVDELLATHPNAKHTRSEQGLQLKITQKNQLLIIDAEKGQIVRISRQHPPGRWINFETWKRKLVRLYRKAEVLGHFPAYASSRSSRLNAINAGKGFAHDRWSQKGWHVDLIWNNPDYILLSYQLNPTQSPNNNDDDL
ncbi:MAG: hypothetical protein Q9O24_07425 [Gammaproteobacteria bacterium]|nr:hypothetical protein [Gammaproteobacteria bacterium]